MNTSGEDSKFGCEPDKILNLIQSAFPLDNINIKGLMTIGSFSEDKELILREFRLLASLKAQICNRFEKLDPRNFRWGCPVILN